MKVPFQKGSSQKFCQPSGTGFDLGFVNINDLAKASPEDVFPLVISAESSSLSLSNDEPLDESAMTTASHAQITQAILEKSDESHFQVKVVKQILWAEGVRYELREIYGISSSTEATSNENGSGTECVICMTQPKDTAVLPCRHMVRISISTLNLPSIHYSRLKKLFLLFTSGKVLKTRLVNNQA